MLNNSYPDLIIYTPTLEGGVGRIIFNLSKGLIEKKYKIEILVNQMTPESFVDPGISILNLNQPRTYKNFFPIARYLKIKRPKSFMSVIYHGNLVSLAAHAISKSKSRMVVCEHIALEQALGNEKFFMRHVLKLLIRIFYRFAGSVVTVSKTAADELKSHGVPKNKIEVIYNPVITNDLLAGSDEKIDLPWFNSQTAPIILSIGRLTVQKDFETLIRAAAEVKKQREVKLLILGDGPEKENLNQLIRQLGLESDVLMPGFVKNPYSYFKYSSVFVLSSRWEGLPTVLIEALAFGVPIVSTDCPAGPKEILQEGKLGRLVEVGDAKAMSNAIIETLDNPLPKPNANDLENFTSDTAVSKYEKVLFGI
jgi:glycosyltransferase involved in cell wall biosynthesis